MIEIEITGKCLECADTLTEDELNIYCGECDSKKYTIEDIKESIEYSLSHDYEWKSRDFYEGYTEQELTLFLNGVLKGYRASIFWITDFFGLTNDFENDFREMLNQKIPHEE